ncbi:hypothetical protein BDZ97DRAFT_1757737 [Flammula alnicola]|nr:hypothetical protein BDZ97DRAFT_1757737 [Flammula alnicola]
MPSPTRVQIRQMQWNYWAQLYLDFVLADDFFNGAIWGHLLRDRDSFSKKILCIRERIQFNQVFKRKDAQLDYMDRVMSVNHNYTKSWLLDLAASAPLDQTRTDKTGFLISVNKMYCSQNTKDQYHKLVVPTAEVDVHKCHMERISRDKLHFHFQDGTDTTVYQTNCIKTIKETSNMRPEVPDIVEPKA